MSGPIEAETVRATLADAREILDEAVESSRLAYQFAAGSYAYDSFVQCMRARDIVAKVREQITFLTHWAEAVDRSQKDTT
jgi:hypothetical protein